jgi:hypothetical protein
MNESAPGAEVLRPGRSVEKKPMVVGPEIVPVPRRVLPPSIATDAAVNAAEPTTVVVPPDCVYVPVPVTFKVLVSVTDTFPALLTELQVTAPPFWIVRGLGPKPKKASFLMVSEPELFHCDPGSVMTTVPIRALTLLTCPPPETVTELPAVPTPKSLAVESVAPACTSIEP